MKSRIAERILSQVLPPDRAASAVGDWMEDIDQRGSIWFWLSVIRTAVSRVWSDLTENPLTLAGIGLLGFARSLLVVTGFSVLVQVAVRSHHYSYLLFSDPPWERWAAFALYYPLQLWWYFQTGRWVARRMPGREVAGYLAIAVTGWSPIFALWTFGPSQFRGLVPAMLPTAVSHDLCLLAGALWLRRKFVRSLARA
jgi:hypothetical protein